MTTDQIRSFIEHSTYRQHGEFIGVGVSGIEYVVVIVDGIIEEIELLDDDGQPLSEDQTYNVALSDYLGISGAYTFDYSQDAVTMTYLPITELLIDYLESLDEETLRDYALYAPREIILKQ